MLDTAPRPSAPVGDAIAVLDVRGLSSRREARELGRQIQARLDHGCRRLVVDLTGEPSFVEGAIVLTLLGVRGQLERCGARLIVAADAALAERLARSLRLDEVLGACASRAESLAELA